VLVFPTSGGRFFEYEDRGMVNALLPKIDRGELQIICVDSVDQESWYNRSIPSGGPPAPAECLRCLPGE
jgi:esterase/lipase superfamily enzyme